MVANIFISLPHHKKSNYLHYFLLASSSLFQLLNPASFPFLQFELLCHNYFLMVQISEIRKLHKLDNLVQIYFLTTPLSFLTNFHPLSKQIKNQVEFSLQWLKYNFTLKRSSIRKISCSKENHFYCFVTSISVSR